MHFFLLIKIAGKWTISHKILHKYFLTSYFKTRHVSKIWCSSDIDQKRNLRRIQFPEAILYDVKKQSYLTIKMNDFFSVTKNSLSTNDVVNKNRELS